MQRSATGGGSSNERARDSVEQEPSSKRRRSRTLRSRSIRVARAARFERELSERIGSELDQSVARPATRAECRDGARPCPFVGCKHHLYLDVSPTTGTIKLNFPSLEVWELGDSCALDVAESGPQPLDRASALLNVTRERVRQIEAVALAKLESFEDARALRDLGD